MHTYCMGVDYWYEVQTSTFARNPDLDNVDPNRLIRFGSKTVG